MLQGKKTISLGKTPVQGNERVVVGLSGGVDSAVTAALLKQRGYDVSAVYLECWNGPGCRSDQDRKDALDVALMLDIPFQVLDFKESYRKKVVDYFYDEYTAGRTPNSDVVCNREIKFGLFFDWAMKNRFEYIATGHYARTDGKRLFKGVDEKKDQSYFLYQLREEQLKAILFPIGDMKKTSVRELATTLKLPVAAKKDSTGICFIGEVSVKQFLKELGMREKEGLVLMGGIEVGKHMGAWFFTIGQRHGFNLDKKAIETLGINPRETPPLFVLSKNVKTNTLVVGTKKNAMKTTFAVNQLHWIGEKIEGRNKVSVRVRHRGQLRQGSVEVSKEAGKVQLMTGEFGISEGQAAVFYDGEICLGGGIITGQNDLK